MRKNRWLMCMGLLILAFSLGGCSSDDPAAPAGDNTPGYGDNYQTPTTPTAMQQSQDPYAQQANIHVNSFGAMSAHTAWLTPPGKAQKQGDGPPWTTTWDYTGDGADMTVTLVIDEDTIGETEVWTWDVYFDGYLDAEVYENFHVYSAWEAKDGSGGYLEWYEYPGGDPLVTWQWWANADGSFDYEFIGYDGGMPEARIILHLNADGSGELDIYEYVMAWVIEMHFEWTALGTGSWISYLDGVEVDSGVWPPPTR
ncbi:hypothetical protein H8E07_20040 [bacterium]|nr:hypothetical protein [bacterium]